MLINNTSKWLYKESRSFLVNHLIYVCGVLIPIADSSSIKILLTSHLRVFWSSPPCGPGSPACPGSPGSPMTPSAPGAPGAPVSPFSPFGPALPGRPGGPWRFF